MLASNFLHMLPSTSGFSFNFSNLEHPVCAFPQLFVDEKLLTAKEFTFQTINHNITIGRLRKYNFFLLVDSHFLSLHRLNAHTRPSL